MLGRVVGRILRSASNRYEYCNSMERDASTSSDLGVEDSVGSATAKDYIKLADPNHVLKKFAALYTNGILTDISLMVGGIEYPAHKLVLCATSDVFQVMLTNTEWSESHETKVVLQESAACCRIFGDFLAYFYTGDISLHHLDIMSLLILADKYNVKDLVKLSVQYMSTHVALAAAHNQLVSWFQYTLSLGHYQVAQACEKFVKWNFEMVSKTSDFGNFQLEILSRLLMYNDLVVYNEMSVYYCVVRWLEEQRKVLASRPDLNAEEEMEMTVQQVMAHVRFPMMTPRQLAELLLSPLTKQYKEFFIERMAIGMSYHSDQAERVAEVCQTEGKLQFTPRLYTADRWSSLLLVENYTQLQSYHTRTLMFSSTTVFAEHAGEKSCDWVVDLYPKGVWFRKCFLIVWQGTVEVPESVLRTVRVSITCKDPPKNGEDLRVKVGLLITGVQDGLEHVMSVIQRNHRFSHEDKVLNFDDILPFDDLNDTISAVSNCKQKLSPFLIGENRDVLKINFVIAPLSDLSSVDNSEIPIQMMTK